jgi:hypothetical protein
MAEPTQADVQRVVRWTIFAVDNWAIENRVALSSVTKADLSRLTVEAALAYLMANDLISVGDEPEWLTNSIPAHLQPDVAAAVEQAERLAYPRGHVFTFDPGL